MSLRTPGEALSELVSMTSGELRHEWVEWKGQALVYSSFDDDGGRTGVLATEAQVIIAQASGDAGSAACVLLDGRIAQDGRVVGTREEITFTGRLWT